MGNDSFTDMEISYLYLQFIIKSHVKVNDAYILIYAN